MESKYIFMDIDSKYIIDGASVIEVIEVGDNHLVPASVMFDKKDYQLFDTRLDARYYCMLKDLQKGKNIENYKSSKYYQYYIERLKEENPEYLL